MAARSKKKVSQPETSQEIQGATLEAAMSAEPIAELGVVSATEIVGLEAGQPGQLEAESANSEVAMDTNIELSEAQASAEPVEPFISLDPNLSIQNAVKLYDRLKKVYAAHDALEIDASHVNSVDTASLQLFVALKKDAIKNKKQVDFFQPSARFIESARLLDLLDILEITHV